MNSAKTGVAINFVVLLYKIDIITNKQLEELAYDLFNKVRTT